MAKKFNLSGGLLNSASVKAKSNKPELILLSLSDIIENEKNFYSTEGIEELAFSIMQAGLKQPLSVIPIENGKYKISAGHRRRKAFEYLAQNVDEKYSRDIPCIVDNERQGELEKLDIPQEDKELFVLITTNREARDKTDYDLMIEVEHLKRIYREMKQAGVKLTGRQRDLIADDLGVSARTIQRYTQISENLDPSIKETAFKEGKIPLTVAESISKLPQEQQKELNLEIKGKPIVSQKDVDSFVKGNKKKSSEPIHYAGKTERTKMVITADDWADFFELADEIREELKKNPIELDENKYRRLHKKFYEVNKVLNEIYMLI